MNGTHGKAVLKFLVVAFLAGTVMAAASFAQSAPVATGTFSLPFSAQWGGLNLGPGTYSFAVNHGGNSYVVHVQQGTRAVGMVMTSVFSSKDMPELEDSALLCVRHSGSCSVGALKMSQVGVFYFNVPQASKTLAAQQPDLIERLPVMFAKN